MFKIYKKILIVIFFALCILCIYFFRQRVIDFYPHIITSFEGEVNLRNYDTLMGVSIGVNVALGTLQGIKNSIVERFKKEFLPKAANYKDRLDAISKSILNTSPEKINSIGNYIDGLDLRETEIPYRTARISALTIATIVVLILFYSASHNNAVISNLIGFLIAISVGLPFLVFSLWIWAIGTYRIWRLDRKFKHLDGFEDLVVQVKAGDVIAPKP